MGNSLYFCKTKGPRSLPVLGCLKPFGLQQTQSLAQIPELPDPKLTSPLAHAELGPRPG